MPTAADIAVPEISTSDCRKFSPAQCRLFPGINGTLNSRFQIVIGIAPLLGFGTFNGSSTSQEQNNPYGNPGLVFNNSWPVVYRTLTETWTNVYTDPLFTSKTLTIVSTFSDFFDLGFQTTVTGTLDDSIVTGFTTTATTISASVTTPNFPHSPFTFTKTYNAVLSDPVPAYSSLVSAAHGMMGNATLPPILPFTGNPQTQNRIQLVFPISTGAGFAIADTANSSALYPNEGFTNIIAAANGVAVQLNSVNPITSMPNIVMMLGNIPFIPQYAQQASIDDNTAFPNYFSNIGGVVCITSRWRLNGSGSGVPGGLVPTETNHKQINGQKMDSSGTGSTPKLLSVITPGSFQNTNQVSANGTLYADPLTTFPQELVFLDTDVGANLYSGGSAQYGILGFRTTPI